ncbi:MAG: bifunctional (p)ppGpp synthetase/guanosine-3',5'-bis(diphosphate) 3'-pyrophosphohydrolase, partial [Peptococcaceae bacterium]|nr:bifunctional (p)ppGpp synthetase/guanosine-3',5'-bis(diphosphate) 3'-pyrophosphohydrolase [Peptococcaceae bacterium]
MIDEASTLFKEILDTVYENNKHADLELIEEVYRFAEDLHKGQFRKSGEPYILHPMNVALILAKLGLDE